MKQRSTKKNLLLIVAVIVIGIVAIAYADDIGYGNGTRPAHDFSVYIVGRDMQNMTISRIATLWEIDEQKLLSKIVVQFGLSREYSVKSTLAELSAEKYISPRAVKVIAEEMKTGKKVSSIPPFYSKKRSVPNQNYRRYKTNRRGCGYYSSYGYRCYR